ncbi:MAG TPA: AAA family ATPase [Candidatus Tectomicrobia bacterium]|jgi:ATP-dependent Lon protease
MQETSAVSEVPVSKLRWQCDPESLGFHTTDEIPPLEGIIGQERAQKALNLGVEIVRAGYNIYVSGTTGTGKLTAVQQLLAARQNHGTPPPDLCYVFHFKNPERPRLLRLPAGQGKVLKKAMEGLLTDLKREIPRVLTSESFQQRKKACLQQAQRREQHLIKQFEVRLAPHFGLLWRDADLSVAPELAPLLDGKLTPLAELEERLEAGRLPMEQYKQIRAQHAALSADFASVFADVRHLRHEAQEAVSTLERALLRPIIQQEVAEAATPFPDAPVQQYFQEVEEALNEDTERFHEPPPEIRQENGATSNLPPPGYEDDLFQEYQVNIVVDNTEVTGPPVIFETSPTYKNLFGTIEPAPEYGGIWRSDYTGIRAGAMHRANGGYLIFNALDALSEPAVWPALKRSLRYHQTEIQAYDQPSLVPSTTLKPEPIPCNVKVIMIGDEELYEALASEDEAFQRLFKVKADFDTTIPRQPQHIAQYAGFIRHICQEEQLRPFDCHAVAAVVEFGVRLAGRQNKLTARLDVIADVLREADYWAGKAGATTVTHAAVSQALHARTERVSLMEEKIQELIAEGLLLLTTHGAVVGQVNGLSVYIVESDYMFGCPLRITAETSMGDAGVVNIEREVNLSDATHNKGVLILSGYLRHTYAQDKPLVLSASLCIEQSYEGIAGDSASAAEMYALLSSLADLPVDQGIAVTGSVNQKGELQPISAINEKVEGFFDVCRMQGLTGRQGVIIPPQNIDDLMLRQDVVEAIATGQFHLYAVASIDDGLPILTGIAAGQRQSGQGYPLDSVNGRVDAQLRRFAEQWYALQHGAVRKNGTGLSPRTAHRRAR